MTATCKSAFYHLRKIILTRKYLTFDAALLLVHALVTSKFVSCNSLIYGLSMHVIKQIQHVQNAAARVATVFPKLCHIAPVLANLLLCKYRTDLVGQYGIYERGRCPSGLKEGFVRWDDDDAQTLSHK